MPTPPKVVELLDKKWVIEKLKVSSPAQLAKELCDIHGDQDYCKRSSVQWVIDRYLSDEEKLAVRLERKHYKGKIN